MKSLITSNRGIVASCRTQRKREEFGQRNSYNTLFLSQKKYSVKQSDISNIELQFGTVELFLKAEKHIWQEY